MAVALLLSLGTILTPVLASAAPTQCNDTNNNCNGGQPSGTTVTDSSVGNVCANKTDQQCLKENPIIKDLNIIVGFLSGLVGVVVVGTIIMGGIQYAAAGDKADAVSAAKKRIINGVIALVTFLFVFAFLQWLIPGGIFS